MLCISKDRFKTFNEIYKRLLPDQSAGADFLLRGRSGPAWFDIEVDCIDAHEELETGDREGRVLAGSRVRC